jgi:hypothetical protein
VDLNLPFTLTPHAITGGISTVVGSVATASYLTWRRWVKDRASANVDAVKTAAEVDVVTHLTSQRDYATAEAREAKRGQLLSDYENQNSKAKITALELELGKLRARVQLLSQLVTRLTTALDLTRNQLGSIIRKATSDPVNPSA